MKLPYLNCGCGSRYHPSWVNVDRVSTDPEVMIHDVRQGIPFPEGSFDVVYHSHLLEHLERPVAETFLKECHRVLRPRGVLRVAVPDLEEIARLYLASLERASSGSQEWADHYRWIMLEMYDQAVRTFSGGEMAAYLRQPHIPDEDFIVKRCGTEAQRLIEEGRSQRPGPSTVSGPPFLRRLRSMLNVRLLSSAARAFFLKLLLGRASVALGIGEFRQGGEVHQWMYDRYSLSTLMEKCGFSGIVQRTATESCIPEWTRFELDAGPDGTAHKPDSLFMEGIKQGR